tara:strand:+ start:10 stop:144 length:135 start_codon:yes stop_codon:yes gene_type:complete
MFYHQRRKTMDKMPTEGQALALIIAIMFGGTLLLNAIVYGLFMS